jgi:RHS repeat-associated protein
MSSESDCLLQVLTLIINQQKLLPNADLYWGAPNGYTVSYGYDAADRVTTITKGNQNFQLGYDAVDRMTGLTMPNGIAASYSFDSAGRISRILYQKGNQTLKDFQYTLDVADQITQIGGTPTNTFGDGLVSTSTANANNQYTAFGSDSLAYDASGNLKTKGSTTYQWDVRDRLIGISGSGLSASFSYDALGRRASKTINGITTAFTYDGSDIIQDSLAQYVQGIGIDEVLSRTVGSNSEYYLKDHLMSTVSLADSAGNITVQYGYSPFGQVSKTGTTSNYFTYTGREDDGTGLYYYRARYYSSDLKRFSAEDPLEFGGGDTNLQAYVANNPTNYRDPSGEIPSESVQQFNRDMQKKLDDIKKARALANELNNGDYKGWRNALPDCPCKESNIQKNNDWAQEDWKYMGSFGQFFHPGANSSYRGKPTRFVGPTGKIAYPSQQCTYDDNGNLIKDGPGAGTPDLFSPRKDARHWDYDVVPFLTLGPDEYTKTWVPNRGDGK